VAHDLDLVDDVTHAKQEQVEHILIHGSPSNFRKCLGLLPDVPRNCLAGSTPVLEAGPLLTRLFDPHS
jgi:hypothetical protein